MRDMVLDKTATGVAVLLVLSALALPTNADEAGGVFTLAQPTAAGDWLVVFVPFAEPTSEAAYAVDWSFEATATSAGPGHVLHSRHVSPLGSRSLEVSMIAPGETSTIGASRQGMAASSGNLPGFAFLFASSIGGNLLVTIVADSVLGPAEVQQGEGTTVRTAEEMFGGGFAPADRITADGTFQAPGWQHVHVQVDHLQPLGAELYDVRLPTVSWTSPGAMAGIVLPVFGIVAPLGTFRYGGTFEGSAGDYHVDFDYVHVSQNVEVYVFDMPGDITPPAFWSTEYAASGAGGCSCLPEP